MNIIMDRQIQPSDLSRPGLYLSCKYRLSDCSSRSKSVLNFISCGLEISFTEVWKECKCSACGNVMGSVSSVEFYRSKWSYWGVVEAGEEVREDFFYAYGFTVCSVPKRFKWKSLCLTAWELTKEEQVEAHTYVLAALETPLISR